MEPSPHSVSMIVVQSTVISRQCNLYTVNYRWEHCNLEREHSSERNIFFIGWRWSRWTTSHWCTVIISVLEQVDSNSYSSLIVSLMSLIYQGSTLIHQKVDPPTESQKSPVLSFISLEQFNAIRLVQVGKNIRNDSYIQNGLPHNYSIRILFFFWGGGVR